MQVGSDFQEMNPGEDEVLSISFASDLGSGETLVSTEWTVAVKSGSDATAALRLNGDAQVDGAFSRQRFTNPVAGVTYLLVATCVTSLDNTIQRYTHLRGVAPR